MEFTEEELLKIALVEQKLDPPKPWYARYNNLRYFYGTIPYHPDPSSEI